MSFKWTTKVNCHALSTMQTSISAEEFARFQSQFLELRKQKYTTEEDLSRAEKKVIALENTLAQQSGELAQLQSRLSSIQRAGDIATVVKENQHLRQRLLNAESSFHLQISTLRAECERLQAENAQLEETYSVSSTTDAVVQTPSPSVTVSTISIACQTFKSGWASAVTQTEATSAEVAEWFAKAKKVSELLDSLESERRTSEGLLKEVSRRELDVERLEGECEALRSELNVAQRRGERVQRELQRQLASALRTAKRAASGNALSLSSLVVIPSTDQNLDGISVESFSFSGGSQTAGNDNGEAPDASSTSQTQHQQARHLQQALFSEEDLKARTSRTCGFLFLPDPGRHVCVTCGLDTVYDSCGCIKFVGIHGLGGLLTRLSEVQEENCNLRHKLKHLQLEVDAKSKIIQRTLNNKFNSSSPSHCANSTVSESHHASISVSSSSSASAITTTPIRLASDLLSTLRSKLKSLELSSSTAALNSTELKGLKRLCEELMTRNISLEQALEAAIAGSNRDLET
ncbi:GRIP1-associated protein [Echinococcus granulosus]|uniref:GRIP1-associated protein n=1 Tax=Echinococcus granulosus TaxID=6210 RepID=W6UKT2_ECHGR|nr:GRIP1-associated protein [Echinococcus granulosus]EUB61771.1 GRIP1-associated protein [Echinococcus granulosus]